MECARLLAMAQPDEQLRQCQSRPGHRDAGVPAGFSTVAWGRRKLRVAPADAGWFQLRLGADARRTSGKSRELFTYVAGNPTRRRFAGGDTFTGGAFAEATADVGRLTLTGGARIDHWQVTDGHLFEKVIATERRFA